MAKFNSIRKEIIEMANKDQKMRHSKKWNSKIDIVNTKRMHEIVDEIGWPTISKVRKKASHYAWLLVQHADLDTKFQKRCLLLLRKAKKSEVNVKNVAYLEDRVRVAEGKKQIYGTQMYLKNKAYIPRPIINPIKINLRRKSVGLGKIEDYIKEINKLPK